MLDFNVAMSNERPKSEKKKKSEAPAAPPAARDPFDIAPIRDSLKVYEAEVAVMKQTAELHQVVDEASNVSGIEMAAQAKRLGKTIEDMRKEKVRPYQDYTKSINNLAKVYTDALEAIERGLKQKIGGYLTQLKLDKLAAERRAQEEARKLQDRLNAESMEINLPQVEVPIPVLNQKSNPVRTEEGSASQRKDWKWQLVAMEEVPRQYLVIDGPAINKAIRAGVRSIPGLNIYQEENVQIRL